MSTGMADAELTICVIYKDAARRSVRLSKKMTPTAPTDCTAQTCFSICFVVIHTELLHSHIELSSKVMRATFPFSSRLYISPTSKHGPAFASSAWRGRFGDHSASAHVEMTLPPIESVPEPQAYSEEFGRQKMKRNAYRVLVSVRRGGPGDTASIGTMKKPSRSAAVVRTCDCAHRQRNHQQCWA